MSLSIKSAAIFNEFMLERFGIVDAVHGSVMFRGLAYMAENNNSPFWIAFQNSPEFLDGLFKSVCGGVCRVRRENFEQLL
ncbi:hypothetical protein [Candidatus Nitrotoga sp. 1052]|uniref:hypothetical protein n=1 Tax=Candidatus Nitrotoga sp. 1052 TaxID=2886964 RepID=UPI001EF45ABD|nr:hypothetical protein [Candidatus Nitrotoga sp. 1052]